MSPAYGRKGPGGDDGRQRRRPLGFPCAEKTGRWDPNHRAATGDFRPNRRTAADDFRLARAASGLFRWPAKRDWPKPGVLSPSFVNGVRLCWRLPGWTGGRQKRRPRTAESTPRPGRRIGPGPCQEQCEVDGKSAKRRRNSPKKAAGLRPAASFFFRFIYLLAMKSSPHLRHAEQVADF